MNKASGSKGKKSSKPPPTKKSKVDPDEETPASTSSLLVTNVDIVSSIEAKRKKKAASVIEFKFNKKRCRIISKSMDIGDRGGGILYWMSRDQRVQGIHKLKINALYRPTV